MNRAFRALMGAATLVLVSFGAVSCETESAETPKGSHEVWTLKANKTEELKQKLQATLERLMSDLKSAPDDIRAGIKAYEQNTKDHTAAIDQALKSLNPDSSRKSK